VPASLAQLTLTLPFNDLDAAEQLFAGEGARIAAVIVEPVVGNMGVLIPREGYLHGLQRLCREHGALFILDEVMTGFRLSLGGAQGLFGLQPDLTTLGKVVGGGLPVGVYGGRREVMAHIAPEGPVYQAGTLSGNPLAMAAGAACLRSLSAPRVYARLEETSRAIAEGLEVEARRAGVALTINRVGSMWTGFFTSEPVYDYGSAKRSDPARFGRFFHGLLDAGVYLPPSQFEAAFVSLAHGGKEVAHTLDAVRRIFQRL
jgi:glutamate-1-semialdehyde 2,1-aminomutase